MGKYDRLLVVAKKTESWLLRLAKVTEELGKKTPFASLADASKLDAKNYQVVANELHAAIVEAEL